MNGAPRIAAMTVMRAPCLLKLIYEFAKPVHGAARRFPV